MIQNTIDKHCVTAILRPTDQGYETIEGTKDGVKPATDSLFNGLREVQFVVLELVYKTHHSKEPTSSKSINADIWYDITKTKTKFEGRDFLKFQKNGQVRLPYDRTNEKTRIDERVSEATSKLRIAGL